MKVFIIIIILAVLFLCMDIIYDLNHFVKVSYHIQTDKKVEPVRFVLLADLHNKKYGYRNQKLLDEIVAYSPDAIMIAGDMITAGKNKRMDDTLEFLGKLAERYPVYYGKGNHELRMELYPEVYESMQNQFMSAVKDNHIELLDNRHADFNNTGITVYGLSVGREFYQRFKKTEMSDSYLNSVLGIPGKDRFNILIAHNPDYFSEYEKWGADLVLSGHVHGGLVRIPLLGGAVSPTLKVFPKYDGGLYKLGKAEMILSRGLGTHTIPLRIFNPGELIFVSVNQ